MESVGETQGWSAKDFSLVVGGPLYQFLCRTHLSDHALRLLHRRTLAAVLLSWGPLLALTTVDGGELEPSRAASFLHDIGVHVRFLVVVPLLLIAELVVHRLLRPLVDQFRTHGLVRADQTEAFSGALDEANRWRNSMLAEVLLLITVYAGGIPFSLHRYVALGADAWFGAAARDEGLSGAGLWLVFVSLPLFQFLLLRWYYRLFVWARFLWRVSRLDLDLNALHPDRAGGLGFLAGSMSAFVPLAVAHGVLMAGMIASRIFMVGAQLPDFQDEVLIGALLMLGLFAGPLTVFAPMLARTKRVGLRSYGALGHVYTREFRNKWLGGKAGREPLLGSGDIQSLADLGNSFSVVEQMRLAPISLRRLVSFTLAFLAPMTPLLLTMMSPEKLVTRLVGLVF